MWVLSEAAELAQRLSLKLSNSATLGFFVLFWLLCCILCVRFCGIDAAQIAVAPSARTLCVGGPHRGGRNLMARFGMRSRFVCSASHPPSPATPKGQICVPTCNDADR